MLQDTFFEAWRGIGTFRFGGEGDSFYRWLVTIARHQMIDLVRAQKAAKRGGGRGAAGLTGAGGETEPVAVVLEQLAVYRRTPSRSAAAHELFAAVEQAVARLPVDQGQAVRLRHLDRLAVAEVAARMNRSEASVQQLCHRALRRCAWTSGPRPSSFRAAPCPYEGRGSIRPGNRPANR